MFVLTSRASKFEIKQNIEVKRGLKVCDEGTLIQSVTFWTLSIVLFSGLETGTSSIDWAQLSRLFT
jgi:hypothetical protein